MGWRTMSLGGLRNPAVWVGFVGSGFLGWGSTNDEFAFAESGWPDNPLTILGSWAPMPFDKVFIIVGVGLLTLAWWWLRPRPGSPRVPTWLTLTLWSLPLLIVPPVLSMDAALYADLGWLQLQGLNPYEAGLATAGGPFADQVDSLWAGQGVAYPPLTLLIAKAMVAVAGAHPWWSIVAMRIPVILSLAVLCWAFPRVARLLGRPVRGAEWLGLLNPLVVVHLVGGAHNDAPMIALTLVALWLVLRYPNELVSLLAAPAVVGVAMALKQQGGLAVIAVAGLPVAVRLADSRLAPRLWLLGWRTAVATAVAGLVFVGITLASGLGFGWTRWLELMGRAPTPAPLAAVWWGVSTLLRANGLDPEAFQGMAGLIAVVVLVAALAWVVVRFSDRPLAAVGWGALAVVVGGQALHPWYLPWALALLALVPLTRRQRRWVYGSAVGFLNWNAVQTAITHR